MGATLKKPENTHLYDIYLALDRVIANNQGGRAIDDIIKALNIADEQIRKIPYQDTEFAGNLTRQSVIVVSNIRIGSFLDARNVMERTLLPLISSQQRKRVPSGTFAFGR